MKLSLLTFVFTLTTCSWAASISIHEELTDVSIPANVQDDLIHAVEGGEIVAEELGDGRFKFLIY